MKLKTNKALSKRLKITKSKRALIRRGGQNHFNAKQSGNTTRKKRGTKGVVMALENTMKIKEKMPYNI